MRRSETLVDTIGALLAAAEPEPGDEAGSCLAPLHRLLQPCGVGSLFLAGGEGELWTAFPQAARQEAADSVVAILARLSPAEQFGHFEKSFPRGMRTVFGCRLEGEAPGAVLGGDLAHEDGALRLLESLRPALLACGETALLAVRARRREAKSAVRVAHLLAERRALKSSQAQAVSAAVLEQQERARQQLKRVALEEDLQTIEAANRTKSEFLADISHEIRTPLHGVLSFAAFGVRRAESAARTELKRYFEKVEQSGEVLLALINDLLDLAKLEAAKMKFEFTTADLTGLIRAVVDEFGSITDHRRISLEYRNLGFPGPIVADPGRIMQVLRNLVGNAVKFSPDGARIEIRAETAEAGVRVCVLDQGPGIPYEELDAVFGKFVQSSRTRTGAGGTGLGLSICEEIVLAHRGRIWAANRSRGGAALCFEIPCDARAARESADAAAAAAIDEHSVPAAVE